MFTVCLSMGPQDSVETPFNQYQYNFAFLLGRYPGILPQQIGFASVAFRIVKLCGQSTVKLAIHFIGSSRVGVTSPVMFTFSRAEDRKEEKVSLRCRV